MADHDNRYEDRKYNDRRYIDYLSTLLKERNFRRLQYELSDDNEVDIAAFMNTLPDDLTALVFRMLPKEMGAEVFAHLSSDAQYSIAIAFTDEETTDLMDELFIDDAVDFLEEMPANFVTRVLRFANPEKRQVINRYLQYPEDSAGSIMTAEYTRFRKDMSVAEAIRHLRTYGENRETIYTCYVTDPNRILEGVISVKTLLLADNEERIGDIMETDVISASTTDDKEDVARLFHKYDFLAIPIVDHEMRLVGIVTVDDAVDVMQQETTEDFEIMAAIEPSEKPYLKTSVFELSRHRIVWLLVLMVSAMISGHILERYETALTALPLLFTFVPMLTDTGGNVGSQSSTLLIRGMTLGEIGLSDIWRVIWKELRVSLLLGSGLAVVNFIRIYAMYHHFQAALIIAITMLATVCMAAILGGILPLFAKAVKLDPAIMAAPLITTLVDAGALLIYFKVATLVIPSLTS